MSSDALMKKQKKLKEILKTDEEIKKMSADEVFL